jgi:hypothetical protein
MMVYQYNKWVFGHYPPSYIYLKNVSEAELCLHPQEKSLLSWAQLIQLVYLQGYTESSLQNVVLNKNRMMHNVQDNVQKSITVSEFNQTLISFTPKYLKLISTQMSFKKNL